VIVTTYRRVVTQVEEFFRAHGVYSTIHNGDFFPMVLEARRKTLTLSNIKAAFRYTGIAPLNQCRVLTNPDLQNPTPTHQTHHNLRPLSTSNTPTSKIYQLEMELKEANSIERARELGNELASLAKSASAQSAVDEKQLIDELKKRKASKSHAGAIITPAEVIGRKALDKAYKDKLARKQKAKAIVENKRKKEEKQVPRLKKRQRVEENRTDSSGDEPEVGSRDIMTERSVRKRAGEPSIRPGDQVTQGPIDPHPTVLPLHETIGNQRRNPDRATRSKRSYWKAHLGNFDEDEE